MIPSLVIKNERKFVPEVIIYGNNHEKGWYRGKKPFHPLPNSVLRFFMGVRRFFVLCSISKISKTALVLFKKYQLVRGKKGEYQVEEKCCNS